MENKGSKRRLIAYIILAATLLVSVVVMATPVFTRLNPGREYTSGNQFVYQLREKNVAEDESDEVDEKGAADEVAEEIKSRLEKYQIEDYSVVVEGNDTIRVSLSENDETQLNYIRRYLAFSGEDISLRGKSDESFVSYEDAFEGKEAYIIRKDDLIPYVIFPVKDPQKVKTFLETVTSSNGNAETNEKVRLNAKKDEGDEEESTAEPDVFMWANWEDGDTYEISQSDKAVTANKILCSFVSSNIWYPDSSEEETELAFLCGFADSENNYDATKLKQANQLAIYIRNMFNASKYEYDVVDLFVTQSASGVTYNTIRADASIENILVFGNDVNLAMSLTLISTLIAIVIVSLILISFYRLSALGMVANTISTVFLTYLLFTVMSATFNVAAFIGGILLAVVSLIAEIIYANKFKEEVYKGRSIKKANQEATKKMNLISLDIAVPTAFTGLMLYFIGGNALRPLGIILFFGAIISLLMNLLVFRLLNYFLTNSANLQSKYSVFGLDKDLVPNLIDEEKATYEEEVIKKDYTTKRKPVAIVALALLVASIAGSIVFASVKGSSLNVSNATKDNTKIYLSIRSSNPELDTVDKYKDDVLSNIYIDGKALSYYDVTMENREEYDYLTTVTTKYTYFVTSIDGVIKENNVTYKIGDVTNDATDISEAIEAVVVEKETISTEDVNASLKISHETVNTPSQLFVILATFVGIVGSTIYLAFRYRPSKALAAFVISFTSSAIAFGVFSLVRIQTTAISVLAVPVIALISLLASILYMSKAKELYLEEKDLTLEKRITLSSNAVSLSAVSLFAVAGISGYLAINYFGFASASLSVLFMMVFVGVIISTALTLILIAPITNRFERWLSKIKLPQRKNKKPKKEKIKLQKKNSSEPEETIFIGIND